MPKKQDPDWTTKDPKGIFTSDESDDKKPAFSTPAPIAIAYDDGSHEHSDNDPGTDYTSASDECEETASDEAMSDEAESDEETGDGKRNRTLRYPALRPSTRY